ncbi:MAG: acetoacetate decarboxylase family protein [Actinomycetota bacterium]|nr:acetoacetate decarboxylase family protein [Actinomycetota bacterium]
MLSGTASLDALAARAPVMPSLEPEPAVFEDTEVLQAAFEMSYASRGAGLPPGLHPTTPPLMVVLVWRVPGGQWGPFTLCQARISCRSGVRPRGFVAACVTDSEQAATALSSGWGFPCRVGSVRLERAYDCVSLDAGPALGLTGLDPDPLHPGDVQYTVTTTLAHTPRGLRLVQVEPEYDLRRVERVRPRMDHFAPDRWAAPGLDPRHPVTATIGVGTLSIPRLRYVSRPEVPAFEGTEAV